MARTVEQILARSKPTQYGNLLLEGYGLLLEINAILDELTAAARPADSSDDWKIIYSDVFSIDPASIGMKTHDAFRMAATPFPEYCDPDGDYDDDVLAWIGAFKEGLKEIGIKVAENRVTAGNR